MEGDNVTFAWVAGILASLLTLAAGSWAHHVNKMLTKLDDRTRRMEIRLGPDPEGSKT